MGPKAGQEPLSRKRSDLLKRRFPKGVLALRRPFHVFPSCFFFEAVRDHIATSQDDGLVAALKDPAVSRAISLVHRNPEEKWTVERLARDCAVSRTVLGERFNRLIGSSPGEYVNNIRMQLSARKLAEHQSGIAEAAITVGYTSEAAFSRAFKRHYGTSPSDWRSKKG